MNILTCTTLACGLQTPAPALTGAGSTNCLCPRCGITTRHLIGQPKQNFEMELDVKKKGKKSS